MEQVHIIGVALAKQILKIHIACLGGSVPGTPQRNPTHNPSRNKVLQQPLFDSLLITVKNFDF
ncbi:MAG: hypothetical protein OXE44_15830 [Nitrospinae bacterium]|nr:hypothetical protein [Nitrospinota bacterium]